MSVTDILGKEQMNWRRIDPLGLLVGLASTGGLLLPFVVFKANRIVPGDGIVIWQALPIWLLIIAVTIVAAAIGSAVWRTPPWLKAMTSALALIGLIVATGFSAASLTPAENNYARVALGSGFWIMAFALAIMLTDALARMRPGPWTRAGLLALSVLVIWALLSSGALDDLSVLKEYGSRAPAFWQETRTHLALALGSVGLATLVGVPIGIACYKFAPLRTGTLNVLNIIQTIPSIALFGMLIAPLGWLATQVPAARAMGISGIGAAPAMVALFAYALLPVVANTLVGLTGISGPTVESARGMGMTWRQRLWRVELPLAFPTILTGIRIVLVQNIGLATIAALIGGGGFGTFVFQGVGQTAIDLVLLGALPTVALAFVAAALLDSLIELATNRDLA